MSNCLQLKRLVPLADRVLVKRVQAATKVSAPAPSHSILVHSTYLLCLQTAGGILLPETNVAKANEGEVLAVGPGLTTKDGTVIKVPLAVGDKVLLPDYGGTQIKIDNEEAVLFRSDEILAKFNK